MACEWDRTGFVTQGAGNKSQFADGSFESKYFTRNPISRFLVRNFFGRLEELLAKTQGKILDVGAGKGGAYMFLGEATMGRGIVAVEPQREYLKILAENAPKITAVEGSIYNLPFADKSFDTVMCLEVLEHLDSPDKGMAELCRVCRRWLIVTVPREPIWRILNLVRGAHLKAFGNTPDHRQHWSRRGFVQFVSKYAEVKDVRSPLPWTIVLAGPKG
jgi:2-polyprenyl-3-methyl-5-hydroxy-6-metoxy-1,4-benzoquinol methylase